MKVGFIGAGRMGSAMIHRLTEAKHEVGVFNRTPDKIKGLMDVGAKATNSIAQAATCGEAVFTMPIDMRFKGTFAELFRFLRQARSMSRLTHVESLNIRNNANLTGACGIDMMMNVYFTRG